MNDGPADNMLTQRQIDPDAREVLSRYPPFLAGAKWTALGNAGGFSGARLWRGETSDRQSYCLRAWPRGRLAEEQLRLIHHALSACRIPIVPRLIPTSAGESLAREFQQFWEITTWMPGRADFHQRPTDARLFGAIRALAEIHDRWRPAQPNVSRCPAVKRIIRAVRDWRNLVQSGFKPDFHLPIAEPIHERARRAWKLLLGGAVGVEYCLHDWVERPLPLQWCLCDVWHDHILYEGDTVTGVIDFGAVKTDCVAIDLARMIGSLIPDEPERMRTALAVYSTCRNTPREVLELVPLLDRVGSVVGLSNWVRWIYHDGRSLPDHDQVVRRMDALLRRLEEKKPTFNAGVS